MKKLSLIMFVVLVFVLQLIALDSLNAAEKQLTFAWEQFSDDLPENGGDLSKWTLYSTFDEALPFDQWRTEGDVDYNGQGVSPTHSFTITVPDGQETSVWFKMTASDAQGNTSDPSLVQEGAPTVIDFKAPVAPVLSASYNNQTKTVTLNWSVDSGDTDVVTQKVFKSSTTGGPYEDVAPGMVQQSPYDYVVQPSDSGKWLYFVVVLTDDDGNWSQSNEVAVKLSMGVPFNIRVTVEAQ